MKRVIFSTLLSVLFLFSGGEIYSQLSNVVIDADGQYMLCGVEKGKWIQAEGSGADFPGGFTYKLYDFSGYIGETTGGAPQQYGMPCEWLYEVPLDKAPEGECVVGIHCSWEPQPRIPEVLPVDNAAYKKIIHEYLAGNGIKNPEVNITNILRVDLEGDGKNEVIISASRYVNDVYPPVNPGDYSIILLRKVVNEEAYTIPVFEEFHPDNNNDHVVPSDSRIAAVLDTNGDGRMEIIIESWYYEGSGKAIYRVLEKEVELVASEGCGV